MTEEQFEQYRIEKAIRLDVWRSQFERYTTEERARCLYPEDQLARNQRAELTKMVGWMEKVGGLIIHRTPIPGAAPITPELRPNEPMLGRKTVHYHGEDQRPETLVALRWNGKPLHEIQIETPDEARFHIAGKKHRGMNAQDVHEHVKKKKYTFLAAPVEHYWRSHTHRWLCERDKLAGHLAARHKDEIPLGLDEEHQHRYARKARGDAARIDLNPIALDLMMDADEFFLGFEGSIKGASMLSEILDTGRKASAASVPSVTLWLAGPDQDELETLVRRFGLHEKRVYIVIDADGNGNPNVLAQALFARDYLRHLGVKAWIVAPPYDENDLGEDGKPRLNGVDDFRNEGGGLDELHALRREPRPSETFTAWLALRGHPRDLSLLRRAQRLQALSLFPASNPLKTTARILRFEKKRQAAAELDELARWGVIRITEGSTGVAKFWKGRPIPEEWAAHEDKWRRTLYARATLEWIDRPQYEFAGGLSRIEEDPVPLKFLDTIPYEGEPLGEVKLVKAGPIDEGLAAVADANGTSAREALESLGREARSIFRHGNDPDDGEPLWWHWRGELDLTRKDLRDWKIFYSYWVDQREPEDIASDFDLSVRQVRRVLGAQVEQFLDGKSWIILRDKTLRATAHTLGLDPGVLDGRTWVTIRCENCGGEHRYEIDLAAVGT
jgi:hypothetical protein